MKSILKKDGINRIFIRLVSITVLLLVIAYIGIFGLSKAWFASNDTVSAGGMSVSIRSVSDGLNLTVYKWIDNTWVLWENNINADTEENGGGFIPNQSDRFLIAAGASSIINKITLSFTESNADTLSLTDYIYFRVTTPVVGTVEPGINITSPSQLPEKISYTSNDKTNISDLSSEININSQLFIIDVYYSKDIDVFLGETTTDPNITNFNPAQSISGTIIAE